MYATAWASRVGTTNRAASLMHSPHGNYLGATGPSVVGRGQPDPPAPAESQTVLYVGIGLGVLAVGGVVYYLATQKKGRR
jgi:hypothetical protein